MPIPADLIVCTLRFDLLEGETPVGIAEITDWIAPADTVDWDTNCEIAAEAQANSWSLHVDPTTYSLAVRLRDSTAIHPAADGSTLNKKVAPPSDPWRGTQAGDSLPWETSLVVSLYTYPMGTFVPNGRQRRGRNYMPPMAAGVLDTAGTGGFVSTALRDHVLGDFHSFLDGFRNVSPGVPYGVPVVVSRVSSTAHPIVSLACDVKLDSQRRRERKEVPPKVAVAFP